MRGFVRTFDAMTPDYVSSSDEARASVEARPDEARGLTLRVVALTTWRVRMARASVYTTARITGSTGIHGTIVGLQHEDGTVGYGYAPGMVLLGESAATVQALLHDVAAPLLLGQALPSA